MNNPKLLRNIDYICLYVSDINESIKFYRDILGLKPSNINEDSITSTWYSFKTGQTILALERDGVRKVGIKTKAENPVLFQFKLKTSEKLSQMNRHLEENGVILADCSKATDYGLITNFSDPDGNKIEIIVNKV